MKEDFEAKNKQLLEEMPKFYSSRIDYFKPSFESLVRAQVRIVPSCYLCGFPALPVGVSQLFIHWNSMALSTWECHLLEFGVLSSGLDEA